MKIKYLLLILFIIPLFAADIGDNFPDFKLESFAGGEVTLDELIGEKPVIISFWATWCKPCKAELEAFKSIMDEYGDKVTFVAINEDGPRSKSKVKPYIKKNEFSYVFLYDASGMLKMKAALPDIPELFVLDTEGKITYHHRGYKTGDEVHTKEIVDAMLAEMPCSSTDETSTAGETSDK